MGGVTLTREDESVNQVAAHWRDALGRAARAGAGTSERQRAAADAAKYEVSHGIALALVPTAETFATSLLRQHRAATASATITRVATSRPAR